MNDVKNRLVLVEFPEDVARLDAAGWLRGESVQRICLAPAPAVKLDALGLDYALPHQFISSAAIQQELNANWQRLNELASLINSYVPFGWTAAYYLKSLLDSCMEKTIHLASILQQKAANGPVVAFHTGSLGYDYTLAFHEAESLYAQLLPLVAEVHAGGRELVTLPSARGRGRLKPRVSAAVRQWLAPYRDAVDDLSKSATKRKGPDTAICFVETGYGLEHLDALLGTNYKMVHWAPWNSWSPAPGPGWRLLNHLVPNVGELAGYRQQCRSAWKAFCNDSQTRRLFTCRGVDFFNVVAPRLEFLFTTVFPHLYVLENRAADFFQSNNIACLVSSYFSRPYTYVLAQVAQQQGIPVVTMQHSAYGYWDWPIAKYFDGIMSNYKLVGGEGVASYVEENEGSGCRPVATGLIHLDRLISDARETAGPSNHRPLVVYPLASYTKNFIHYSNSRLAVTEYFEINRKILGVLGQFADIDVEVHPHPAWRFEENAASIKEWIERQGWEHIRVTDWGNTVAAMKRADLIIIDSPSTVLLQATATNSKIMLLNLAFPMTELGLTSLKKRVVYSEDLDSFLRMLKGTLQHQDFSNEPFKDNSFLRLFGSHLHDGQSLQRAAEAVRQIEADSRRDFAKEEWVRSAINGS